MSKRRGKTVWRIVRKSRLTGRVTRRYASGLESREAALERMKTLTVKPDTDREHVVIESYRRVAPPGHQVRAQDVKAPMGRARFWRGRP